MNWYFKLTATFLATLGTICGEFFLDPKDTAFKSVRINNGQREEYVSKWVKGGYLLCKYGGKLLEPITINMVNKLLEHTGWTNLDASSGLSTYCIDLVELAKEGKIRETIGRENEIKQAIATLCAGDNPCLVGSAGVGKSAIAENLAVKIAKGEVPDKLKDKKIWMLNFAGLKAGNGFSGDYISRVKTLIESLQKDRNNILFFDEIHQMMEIADHFKSALAKENKEGGITIIGTTTSNEYLRTIGKDSALHRRFTLIGVEESTKEETLEILNGLKKEIEEEFGVIVLDEAMKEAVRLSEKYREAEYFPAKAIKLVRQTASYCEIHGIQTVDNQSIREYLSLQLHIPTEELATL